MATQSRIAFLLLSLSLAATATPAQPAAQRDDHWGPVGPGDLRTQRRASRAGERMLERAQADRAVPERDARRGAAIGNADANAKCMVAVQKRLAEGRTEAARRKMESCRRRADRTIAATHTR